MKYEIWKRVSGLSNSEGWQQAGQSSTLVHAQACAQEHIINDDSIIETSVIDTEGGNEVASYMPWAPSFFHARTANEILNYGVTDPLEGEAA